MLLSNVTANSLLGPNPTGLVGMLGYLILAFVLIFNPKAFAEGKEARSEETLKRAINLHILPDEPLRTRQINRLEAEGFLLVRPLDRALVQYEQSGQSFEMYLPNLLESLNNVDLFILQH